MKRTYTFASGDKKTETYKKGDQEALLQLTDALIQDKYYPETKLIRTDVDQVGDYTIERPVYGYRNPIISVTETKK